MNTIDEKLTKLKSIIGKYKKAAIAYSGGVDSTLLLYIASQVLPVAAITAVGVMQPESEREFISEFSSSLENVIPVEICVNPLELEDFKNNTPDRCYACKKHIFTKILDQAHNIGCDVVFDGSNLDDLGDYRPGMRALEELEIESPFLEAGLDKSDIYYLSKRYDLPTKNKQSSACLASRIKTGERITAEKLKKIDEGEKILGEYGLKIFRLRVDGDRAWIECGRDDFLKFNKSFNEINKRLSEIGITVSDEPKEYIRGNMNNATEETI